MPEARACFAFTALSSHSAAEKPNPDRQCNRESLTVSATEKADPDRFSILVYKWNLCILLDFLDIEFSPWLEVFDDGYPELHLVQTITKTERRKFHGIAAGAHFVVL
ncbi:unnamed protein product, partial [Laminaria digitata]